MNKTLLHLAVDFTYLRYRVRRRERHELDIEQLLYTWRSEDLQSVTGYVHLLLQCQCDVNSQDMFGDTALHICAPYAVEDRIYYYKDYEWPQSYSAFLLPCMQLLVNSSAHIDVRNKQGQTPRDLSRHRSEVRQLLDGVLSLQCLAATVIRKHPHVGCSDLSIALQAFVALH
jgi:hypothetical protein